MTSVFCRLGTADLAQLGDALRAGRLAPPFSPALVGRYVAENWVEAVAAELRDEVAAGGSPATIARSIDLLHQDRKHRPIADDLIDLVWTGPEVAGIVNRDTSVVVRELFRSARHSVLIAGYAVHQGPVIFKNLAERMDSDLDLDVVMFLDIQKSYQDTSTPAELERRFAERFIGKQWPGRRLPQIYYDPRSLDLDPSKRSSLHAKCVIVDCEKAFVSSANFTEAAQTRNIEVGLLVKNSLIAQQLDSHFRSLAAAQIVKAVLTKPH